MPRIKTNLKTFSSPAEDSSKKIPKKLRDILRFAYTNRFSDFYRKKFDAAGITLGNIKILTDFQQFPFTSKEEIMARDPDGLLFLPLSKVDYVRFSSGTSGRGLSVVYKAHGKIDEFYKDFMKDVRRVLVLNSPRGVPQEYDRYRSLGKLVVVGEPQNLEASSILAEKTKVDTISASASLLLLFTERLKQHYSLDRIKLLRLHAEGTTPLQRKLIKNQYPNALVIATYSSTETGNIAYQCP